MFTFQRRAWERVKELTTKKQTTEIRRHRNNSPHSPFSKGGMRGIMEFSMVAATPRFEYKVIARSRATKQSLLLVAVQKAKIYKSIPRTHH